MTRTGNLRRVVLFPEHDGDDSEGAPAEQRVSAAELQQEAEGRHPVHPGQLNRNDQNGKGT